VAVFADLPAGFTARQSVDRMALIKKIAKLKRGDKRAQRELGI